MVEPVKPRSPRKTRRVRRKWPTVILLQEMFAKMGYELKQTRGSKTLNFMLISKTNPERWGWVINPDTDLMVKRPLELTLEQWEVVAKANVKRINAYVLPDKDTNEGS